MKKFVHNGTVDNSNMPLDIEERKKGWEEEKEGEERRMEGHRLQIEAYNIDA